MNISINTLLKLRPEVIDPLASIKYPHEKYRSYVKYYLECFYLAAIHTGVEHLEGESFPFYVQRLIRSGHEIRDLLELRKFAAAETMAPGLLVSYMQDVSTGAVGEFANHVKEVLGE